jgi:hypothetical protein
MRDIHVTYLAPFTKKIYYVLFFGHSLNLEGRDMNVT